MFSDANIGKNIRNEKDGGMEGGRRKKKGEEREGGEQLRGEKAVITRFPGQFKLLRNGGSAL